MRYVPCSSTRAPHERPGISLNRTSSVLAQSAASTIVTFAKPATFIRRSLTLRADGSIAMILALGYFDAKNRVVKPTLAPASMIVLGDRFSDIEYSSLTKT